MILPNYSEAKKRTKNVTLREEYNLDDSMKTIGVGKTYFIKTYGCQMNEHDTENLKAMLEEMSFSEADDYKNSDLIILNTCSIRENAHNKAFGMLGRLKHLKEEKPGFDPCNSVGFLDLAHSSKSQQIISSAREQPDIFSKQKAETGSMEDFQNVLKPCSLCEKRPRDGNIIHGKTSHLTTCFHCARRLKKSGASCPVCNKEIQLVIKVFIA